MFDDDLCFKIESRAEAEEFVRGTSVTVGAAVLASTVRIEAVTKRDIGTVVGLVLGIVLITAAILLGGSLAAFVDVPSVLIVLGGSMAATFIRFTLPDVLNSISVAMKAFFAKARPPEDIIQELVTLSNIARKEGLLKLEKQPIDDPFLKKAIM